MLDIYHFPRSRSNRIVWLCEEMGVPYRTIPSSLRDKPPELLAANPGATLPFMIDGDIQLFESVTIMEYITEAYGPTDLVLRHDEPGYWDYRQILLFGEATLAAPLNAIVGTTFTAPEDQRQNVTVDIIRGSFKKRLGVLAKRLEASDYVAGGRFTIADISAAYAIILALKTEVFGLADLIGEDLIPYVQRLTDREAYQRMLHVK